MGWSVYSKMDKVEVDVDLKEVVGGVCIVR